MKKRTAVVGIGSAALAAAAVAKVRRALGDLTAAETGTLPNSMEYARWGDGAKSVLWIPGGPGSEIPHGLMGAFSALQFRALLEDGYTVWWLSRRRHMPLGHSVKDMADDYARAIRDSLGGRVDVVVGISYGGMIAQHLAADHADLLDRVVLALSAARITDWGRDVDYRWAQARVAQNWAGAGRAMAEYFFPEPAQWRQRNVLGAVLSRAFITDQVPGQDLRVEAEAEMTFDARDVLPRIRVPVLLISAERDMFFTPEIIEETAAALKDCRTVRYPGIGHVRGAMSPRIVQDVLEFASG